MRILEEDRTVKVGNYEFGGDKPLVIAGPCSVENRDQIIDIAKKAREKGAHLLRGGVFKPRTSPYDFQGIGIEALTYMVEAKQITGMPIVTELMDLAHLDYFLEHVDVIQIGSRNMYNYPLLKALGEIDKPVLLKRGFSATIKEWICSAEYIAKGGNTQIILCERGIRSFDSYTRNMLDLTAVPIMKKETGLPVIVDPSHGTGRRELVGIMSKAALAAGADGLIIEAHTHPDLSVSDKEQTIGIEELGQIIHQMTAL
ncbi:3-deoxy-7-phosphoheptulonate synthase [Fusibacter tunisiensis]|uniref:3-deoxy-7-phosphoheptulonate synthase n=1 Tax=Fusibacter tunisiensis TaxID=1008308 RepID=A0ABS2MTA6_9FIRM|nr:3-deoxy-7-phosphoheptulonate synthase [Fusibacter tunisiensis]MBM7562636.1 3-deoxy-7-phosphoheptulonate synthase [Fusibacter tunisiensis]